MCCTAGSRRQGCGLPQELLTVSNMVRGRKLERHVFEGVSVATSVSNGGQGVPCPPRLDKEDGHERLTKPSPELKNEITPGPKSIRNVVSVARPLRPRAEIEPRGSREGGCARRLAVALKDIESQMAQTDGSVRSPRKEVSPRCGSTRAHEDDECPPVAASRATGDWRRNRRLARVCENLNAHFGESVADGDPRVRERSRDSHHCRGGSSTVESYFSSAAGRTSSMRRAPRLASHMSSKQAPTWPRARRVGR